MIKINRLRMRDRNATAENKKKGSGDATLNAGEIPHKKTKRSDHLGLSTGGCLGFS